MRWKDFEAEWLTWWPLQHYPDDYKSLVLIYCLPAEVSEIYRALVLNLKHTFEQVWSDLRKAYKTDDGYSLRSRWYGLKCTAATLNG